MAIPGIKGRYVTMNSKCYSYTRFSTPEQSKGTSLLRQTRLAEEYAKEHGLELDNSLKLTDLGLSAFKGDHVTKGALGRFLENIKSGKIAQGSVLIVENLDRLSRDNITEALQQFLDIIKAGVRIVTLSDGNEYDKDSINSSMGSLMISLAIMARAHEESQTKSKRIKSAWDIKRENIESIKLTSICPAWLKLSKDKKTFEVIAERGQIILNIFNQKKSGKSTRYISTELNKQNIWLPDNRKRNNNPPGWRESYIQKILRNRSVIGEFQPKNLKRDSDGKKERLPTGDPIENYFPSVVPKELFYSVQEKLDRDKAKAGNGGGRTGKINNLFGYLAKCGYCGASMAFIDKGKSPKGGSYLICDTARRGLPDCKRRPIRYNEFEELILTYCRGLTIDRLLPEKNEIAGKLKGLKDQLTVLKGEEKIRLENIENLADTIASTSSQLTRELLDSKLSLILDDQEKHKSVKKTLQTQIIRMSSEGDRLESQLKSFKDLLSITSDWSAEKRIEMRIVLREMLRNLIDRIEVYPVGRVLMTEPKARKVITLMRDLSDDPSDNFDYLYDAFLTRIENKDLREYTIYFKSQSIRTLSPTNPNTLIFDADFKTRKVKEWRMSDDGENEFWEYEA